MKSRFDRRSVFKLTVILSFAFGLGIVSFVGSHQPARASAFGPTPSFSGAPLESNCTACHGDFPVNSGKGSIEIEGISSTYTPGQEFNVKVTVRQADAVIYGFQLTAIDSTGQKIGTYTIPAAQDDRIQVLQGVVGENNLLREYMEHKSGGLSNGQFGFNSWTFQWKAPAQAVGRIDFYAAGNAANSDGSPGGDNIYTATASTSPASASTFSISGRVVTPIGVAIRNARVLVTLPNGDRLTATTGSFGTYSITDLPGDVALTLSVVQPKRYRFAPRLLTLQANATNVDFTGQE